LFGFGGMPIWKPRCIVYIEMGMTDQEERLPLDFRARLVSVRARVPMYRLFLKIFFWYWLTAWGMIAVGLLGSRLTAMSRVSSAPNMYAMVAPIMAAEAVKSYESGGPEAFARFSQSNIRKSDRQLFLLDGFYRDVLSRPLTGDALRAAHLAKDGELVVLRGRIAAYKFVSSSGHPYILMLYMKSELRQVGEILLGEGLPFSVSLILLVTILCLALAYHIASPIHSIQSTARKVAQGDLKARVPSSVSRRFDELAPLAKDFDSMVSRLDSLIQNQKNLLNSVSHELRSPLARINISLALLRKRFSADSDELFQRLDRDVVRIDSLLGQLLTLSRLESGFSSGEKEDLDFSQLLEEVVADANFEAQALGKSITLQASGSIILRNVDPHALRSACENIIRNAVRFTPYGSAVEILLRTDQGALEPLAFLSIRDHGPGVPEDSLQAIFQPFFRINRDADTAGGNGLGLAIASEAIRLHRGMIRAKNIRPTGLEIIVELPFAYDIASDADARSDPDNSTAGVKLSHASAANESDRI
jgi:two-component system, OmpR family, sensor histidine kinase CpxA